MPAIWAALTAVLGNLVRSRIGFWIASALAAFGLHIVATEFAIEPAVAAIQSQMTGMGATAVAWFAYLRVDEMVTIILSAYAAASAISGIRISKATT